LEKTTYVYQTSVNLSFEETIQKVTEELKQEGFGILTEIDVKDTLKRKLDVDFGKYKILGACNPPNAYKALLGEIDIGLMLPCNVVVYEGEGDATLVAAVDPVASMRAVDSIGLEATALEVRMKLQRVIEAMER
jgi:uncharacterized protein (DUF302 family)